MDVMVNAPEQYRFGRFHLEPARRLLTSDGVPVTLSSRAFDLLCLLVARRDRVVSKDELRAEVWRGQTVDDNNLAVQISVLRRALGEKSGGQHVILTVPGQGYQFVAVLDEPVLHKLGAEAPAFSVPAMPPALPVATPAAPRPLRTRVLLPIGVGVLALAFAIWVAAPRLWPPAGAPRLSLVVLPFRNLSGEAEQDYLADAISDDLTTDLSHIPGSIVIARTSADTYRGRPVQADLIGRALNVRYLLEGSLRTEGGNLHINAQLIDAPTGAHLWARVFDVERDRLGVARTAIVRNIASALNVTLVDIESARSLHDRPDNADAVDFFLRARSLLGRSNTLASLTEAQALLEHAVTAEPNFADALATLGYVLVRKIAEFDDPAEAADQARAQVVITRAVALAPQNPAAVAAKGYLAWEDGRCGDAIASFRLALSLAPDDVQAQDGMVVCARQLGRMQDMIDGLTDLLRIDPASTANAKRQQRIGFAYLMLGKPAEALPWLQRAGASLGEPSLAEPTTGWQEWRQLELIAATGLTGDPAGARKQYAAYRALRPHRTVWRLAAYETRAQSALPGQAAYRAALRAAGMPEVAREDEDFGVPPTGTPHEGGDFDPTPLSLPGASLIGTTALKTLLDTGKKPLILDLGHGTNAIPGAIWLWQDGLGDRDRLLDQALAHAKAGPGDTIVVMADGPTGWIGYNAALHIVARGFRSVLWYRGGEESWSASGNTSQDRRPS